MPDASGDEVLPEHAIFMLELIGEFPQQLFYPAADPGRQTDGINASDSGHDQAAACRRSVFRCQGNSSCKRLCGSEAMRAKTSASQACGSTR
jgi:hypothetical protein